MCAGKVLNYAGVSVLTPAEMSASARRVLRFIDLGGHEKYLKTALYGMTCMVCVTAMCWAACGCLFVTNRGAATGHASIFMIVTINR